MARTTVVSVSPSTCTVSLSKKRRKKCCVNMRVTLYPLAVPHLHNIHQLSHHLLRMGLPHQLRKGALQRGEAVQSDHISRRRIGHYPSLRQHEHAAANPLDYLQHMRDVEDRLAFTGQ